MHLFHKSTAKLRKSFGEIIERYSQNFDEEADEIDLFSLEIIKNNGHLGFIEDVPVAAKKEGVACFEDALLKLLALQLVKQLPASNDRKTECACQCCFDCCLGLLISAGLPKPVHLEAEVVLSINL